MFPQVKVSEGLGCRRRRGIFLDSIFVCKTWVQNKAAQAGGSSDKPGCPFLANCGPMHSKNVYKNDVHRFVVKTALLLQKCTMQVRQGRLWCIAQWLW